MTKKSQQFHISPNFGPEKCPVYLHLSWLSTVSNRFENQVTSNAKHCYPTVERHVVYKTNQLLPVTNKDVLPALQNGNVTNQFRIFIYYLLIEQFLRKLEMVRS